MNGQNSRFFTNIKPRGLALRLGLWSAAILMMAACAQEREAPPMQTSASGPPPVPASVPATSSGPVGIELYPAQANRSSIVFLAAQGLDISSARIQWYVDGRVAEGLTGTQFACSNAPRGAELRAAALVRGKEYLSNAVQVGNTPPSLTTLSLLPVEFKPGDNLMVEAAGTDDDGDPVTFKYLWTRNGQSVGNASKLAVPVKRGDMVSVRVTPFDGFDDGDPTTLVREIRNFPPAFREHDKVVFQGDMLVYQAKAVDPDGDPVTYSLESPSADMTIGPGTGTLVWTVPAAFRGDRQATIVAEDGHGGRASYAVTLTVK